MRLRLNRLLVAQSQTGDLEELGVESIALGELPSRRETELMVDEEVESGSD